MKRWKWKVSHQIQRTRKHHSISFGTLKKSWLKRHKSKTQKERYPSPREPEEKKAKKGAWRGSQASLRRYWEDRAKVGNRCANLPQRVVHSYRESLIIRTSLSDSEKRASSNTVNSEIQVKKNENWHPQIAPCSPPLRARPASLQSGQSGTLVN